MRRTLLVAAFLGAAAGVALGQALTSVTLTGNEVVTAAIGGPGGTSIFIPVSQLRNTQGPLTTALVSGALTLTNSNALLLTTAIVSGAMTVTTPPAPWDGELFVLANGSGSPNTATVTLTANTGQTVNGGAVATQAAVTSAEWRYLAATTTWYRIR